MIQGASSSVGKSLLTAALCRIYARRGVNVAPFKAQNMSNNAAVCADGSEIGRAQALQAVAAGLQPRVEMNPILIKPEADSRAQIILRGRPWQNLAARSYYENKALLWEAARTSLDTLRTQHDLVIIEGAGSPAELNLKKGDIVNMAVARYAHSPVLLVGDIDRGGVFAQLLGTLWLLEPEERALVRGLIVNKFRGDITLFQDGIQIIEERGGCPVLGVVPYLKGLALPDEDAVSVETPDSPAPFPSNPGTDLPVTEIAILALPRIANFDDFDPLKAEPGVRLRYVRRVEELGTPHAILIPGTKSTLADLAWLRETGLAQAVQSFARAGGAVAGICGGYQMLGQVIFDPLGVESAEHEAPGLGLLPIQTHFYEQKSTYQARAILQSGPGWFAALRGTRLNGYEIHMGQTQPGPQAWLKIEQRNGQPIQHPDGAASPDGKIWGCYLHGLFANDAFRRAWLESLGWQGPGSSQATRLEESLNALADAVETALDMSLLEKIIWEN